MQNWLICCCCFNSQVFLCPERKILYVPRISLKHQNIIPYFRRPLVFSPQGGQLSKMCKKGETTKGISWTWTPCVVQEVLSLHCPHGRSFSEKQNASHMCVCVQCIVILIRAFSSVRVGLSSVWIKGKKVCFCYCQQVQLKNLRPSHTGCKMDKYTKMQNQNFSHRPRHKFVTETQENELTKKFWQDTPKVLGTETKSLTS